MVLVFWGLPAVIGAIVFIPQLFRYERARGVASAHVGALMRDPLAWQVRDFSPSSPRSPTRYSTGDQAC